MKKKRKNKAFAIWQGFDTRGSQKASPYNNPTTDRAETSPHVESRTGFEREF